MKVRRNFLALPSKISDTVVYDAVSLTQPDMSLSIKEIVERFAFVGDTPVGMMSYPEPHVSTREDEQLFELPDVERMDIAELEDLSAQLMARAEWLRAQPPAPIF